MKKLMVSISAGIMLLAMALVGCNAGQTTEIFITVPAGKTADYVYIEDFVYSDTVFTTTADMITISAGEGLSDTEVVLKPVKVQEENAYERAYLTPGMPVVMDVEKGAQFRVGIAVQNPGEEDFIRSVEISNITIE